MTTKALIIFTTAGSLQLLGSIATSHAAGVIASDGATNDWFGVSVNQSGSTGLVGAVRAQIGATATQGAVYVYQNLDTASGIATQSAKLISSDGASGDRFGSFMSQSGNTGLVGAYKAKIGSNTQQGAAYVYRNLDTVTGTATENVKLIASDGGLGDSFGFSVSLVGNTGLVGAYTNSIGYDAFFQGSAYVYRNLDTATGTVTQNAKLIASDGAMNDAFGFSVSQSGSIGLVGAFGSNTDQGAAYVYRNLDTATGTVTQNVKLIASDGAASDHFGYSVSQSGSAGLVGAYQAKIGSNTQQGAAYVYRNLDTATGAVTQNAKLIASDGVANDSFGFSVSKSGSIGLVGANRATIGPNTEQGAAYVYRNLDTAIGTATENVKLIASDGAASDHFGASVSLDGDQFLIGADYKNSFTGKAYSGSVSSFTTLNAGNASRTIDGISFISQDDWIIGQSTNSNQVTLLSGNTGSVTATGKAVYIGQNAGSNNNTLIISGAVNATQINVGAAGNTGNRLVVSGSLSGTTTVAAGATLASGHNTTSSVGAVAINGGGTLAPGDTTAGSYGKLNVNGALTLGDGFDAAQLSMKLGNTTAGTEYDQVVVAAAVTLNKVTLALDTTGYTVGSLGALDGRGDVVTLGDTFYLVLGASIVTNTTFDNENESASIGGGFNTITSNTGVKFAINYHSDGTAFNTTGGNQIAVMVVAVPEPSTWSMLVGGMGSLLLLRRRR